MRCLFLRRWRSDHNRVTPSSYFCHQCSFFLKYQTLETQLCICIHEDLHLRRIQAQTSHLPTGVWVFFCTDVEMWSLVKSIAINTQCFAPTMVTNYKLRAAAWPPWLRPQNLPTVKLFSANHEIHKFTCHTFVTCDESHVMNVTDVWKFWNLRKTVFSMWRSFATLESVRIIN